MGHVSSKHSDDEPLIIHLACSCFSQSLANMLTIK